MTKQEYLKGRHKHPTWGIEFTEDIEKHCIRTIAKVSELLSAFGEKRQVIDGWCPRELNKSKFGTLDKYLFYGQAVILEDKDGKLGMWCLQNVERLIELGLFMKSVTITSLEGIVYLQSVPPKCGSRIFQ
jgi:hypothetical protein